MEHEPDGFARIKVVGVGGGGCNAVDSMFDIGLQNVEFYVINSDLQALKRSKCPNRIQIGAELTKGRGCGAAPELGERCMLDAKEEVIETLQGADIVFVTAGLGGGTGTGAAPVIAQIAKEMGILTVSVVTKPFKFEGPRRLRSAEGGLEKLRDACDTMIVINNERLLEHVGPKVPIKDAFKVADNVLAQAVTSISDLVATPGLINVDFNDIRTIMGGKGGAVMGVGIGKGENRAAEAVKKATSSPLLDKIVIDGATGVLICITGGPDLTLQEVSEATQMVHESADMDAEMIFGAVIDESMSDQIRVTIIATGFAEDIQRRQMMGQNENSTPIVEQPKATLAAPPAPAPAEPAPQAVAAPKVEEAPAPQPRRVVISDDDMQDALGGALAEEPKEAPKQEAPAPVEAPKAEEPQEEQPKSLRETLEAMMKEQGVSSNGGANGGANDGRPAIRVAKSSSPNGGNGGNGGSSKPNVRPASEAKAEAKPAEENAPQVSLFDPQEEQEEKDDYETPAFLRRRRSLFD